MKKKPGSKDDAQASYRYFCPVCGSTRIVQSNGKFECTNCRNIFQKPKKTKIEGKKSPRYIG